MALRFQFRSTRMTNQKKSSRFAFDREAATPINQLAEEVISSFAGKFREQMINVDADMEPVRASVDSQAIHSAVSTMIENAIQSVPGGGNINVTLIDGKHQWELEVADSVGEIYGDRWKKEVESNNEIHARNLKRISAANPRLDSVRSTADRHGGQLQSLSLIHI